MSEAERVHAVEGLFAETADGARLLGSQCRSCSTAYFPRSKACHNPDCEGSDIEELPEAEEAHLAELRALIEGIPEF